MSAPLASSSVDGPATTSVVIADDHPIVRRGLHGLLAEERDLVVAAEVADGDALLAAVEAGRADVVVLDLSLPGARGLDLLRRLRTEHPRVPVLVLSIHPEEPYAVRCLKAGAAGYVEKSSDPAELLAAIRTVVSGRRYLSARVADRLVGGTDVRQEREPPHETLSEREFQVMCRIAGGRTISEIAAELELSVKTVSTYRARLLAKMGLRTNSEITRYVFEHQLLPV
ncbi:MAG TPA: response regulator transcription factor [Thermoanaerobaculia bacterium]|jgi:DNA-binding NarL/FixJ family response regulator|nr:response regulator transcription factor [Thermoanaerobaculia bacterium]